MGAQDEDQVRKWAADINEAVGVCSGRPRTLLAFLNPYGGSGRAPAVWEGDACPILTKAGTHLLDSVLTCKTAKLITLVERTQDMKTRASAGMRGKAASQVSMQ